MALSGFTFSDVYHRNAEFFPDRTAFVFEAEEPGRSRRRGAQRILQRTPQSFTACPTADAMSRCAPASARSAVVSRPFSSLIGLPIN